MAVLVGDPDAWGKGVAREAERQACMHAFRDHGAHRIRAETPATNRAAQKVVTHLGFKREGVMRRAIRRGDEAVDNEIWGLLPGDFTGFRGRASLIGDRDTPVAELVADRGWRRRRTTSSDLVPSTTRRG